mgnify:CR=1 FL=1
MTVEQHLIPLLSRLLEKYDIQIRPKRNHSDMLYILTDAASYVAEELDKRGAPVPSNSTKELEQLTMKFLRGAFIVTERPKGPTITFTAPQIRDLAEFVQSHTDHNVPVERIVIYDKIAQLKGETYYCTLLGIDHTKVKKRIITHTFDNQLVKHTGLPLEELPFNVADVIAVAIQQMFNHRHADMFVDVSISTQADYYNGVVIELESVDDLQAVIDSNAEAINRYVTSVSHKLMVGQGYIIDKGVYHMLSDELKVKLQH